MSVAWTKLMTLLCVVCTTLSDQGSSGVVWKKAGEAFTFQCRTTQKDEFDLELFKGLYEESLIVSKHPKKETINQTFEGRLQLNGAYPNVDIFMKNLSSQDTGPYWCVYSRFDQITSRLVRTKGNGSVLLVVTEGTFASATENQDCERRHPQLVLVSVVIAAAVLLGFIVGALVWIKTKAARRTVKTRGLTNNDVYEDMRATLRH